MTLTKLKREIEYFVERHIKPVCGFEKSSAKVIHDGLWRTLRLRPIEVAVINTPLLQRLRQIHQTGAAYLTFPSTTHTRFEHTLGVIQQIQEMSDALTRTGQTNSLLLDNDINDMRMAALLHDVGHGPFSHTSEEYYGSFPQIIEFKNKYEVGKPHEILSSLIIRSEVFKEFSKNIQRQYPEENIKINEISKAIIGDVKVKKIFKQQLLNGPFDADKLDYIFRDSHFSGIPLTVDLHRLWYTLRIRDVNNIKQLVVTQSGAIPLEQIFFSKMVLFSVVYHHHKVRACDCMFKGIIEYMVENEIAIDIKGHKIKWDSPVDFLWLTDNSLLDLGYKTKKKNLHKLIHNLYYRRLLKRALIISNHTIEDNGNFADLTKLASPNLSFAEPRKRDIAKEIWKRAKKPCLLQEIWVDLPSHPNMNAAQSTYILPSEAHEPIALNDMFPTDQWTKQFVLNKWRGHVFCPPQHIEVIKKASKEILEENFSIKIKPEAFTWCKQDPPN